MRFLKTSCVSVTLIFMGALPIQAYAQVDATTPKSVLLTPPQAIERELSIDNKKVTAPLVEIPSASKVSPESVSCVIDLSPIDFTTNGTTANVNYAVKGTLVLSKGTDPATGKSTVDIEENSVLHFASPVLTRLTTTMAEELNAAGNRANGCQNSFGGASAWISSAIPPRIAAKAVGTKRSCSCATVLCPVFPADPGRLCDRCLIQDIAGGEAEVKWRIDVRIDASQAGIELPVIEEYRSTSMSGGVVFDLMRDLGIVDLLDRALPIGLTSSVQEISQTLSAAGNIVGQLRLPELPIRTVLKDVSWTAPQIPPQTILARQDLSIRFGGISIPIIIVPEIKAQFLEPYALAIKKSSSFFERTACIVSRCIRQYGIDGTRNGACPDL